MATLDALWLAVINGLWKSGLAIGGAWLLMSVLRTRLPVTRCTVWSWSGLSAVPFTLFSLIGQHGRALLPSSLEAGPAVLSAAGAPSAILPWAALPILVWATGAVLSVLWLLLGVAGVVRLRREAQSLPEGRAHCHSMVARQFHTFEGVELSWRTGGRALGRWRAVEVLTHPKVRSPLIVGLGRPAIILPRRLVSSLPAGDLRLVVAHELAHVARRDGLMNLAERLVGGLFWMSPLHHWAFRRARQAREEACDEWVVAMTGDRPRYAKCLLRVAASAGRIPGILAAQALLHNPSLTTRRIESMLNNRARPIHKLPAPSGGAIALAAVLLAPAVSRCDLVSSATSPVHKSAPVSSAVSPEAAVAPTVVASPSASAATPAATTSNQLVAAASQPGARASVAGAARRPRAAAALGSGRRAARPSDVPGDHWAAEAVAGLYDLGLMEGYPDKKSARNDGKRRPMGLLSETEIRRHLPADVPADHWAAEAVAYLFKLGVLEGYPGGTFKRPAKNPRQPRRPAPFADVPFD